MSKVRRNLDGIMFRMRRDGRWENVCYSDLTDRERDQVAAGWAQSMTPEQQVGAWKRMANILADELYHLAEELGYGRES